MGNNVYKSKNFDNLVNDIDLYSKFNNELDIFKSLKISCEDLKRRNFYYVNICRKVEGEKINSNVRVKITETIKNKETIVIIGEGNKLKNQIGKLFLEVEIV